MIYKIYKNITIYLYFLLLFLANIHCNAADFDADSLNQWLIKTNKIHNLAGMTAVIVQDGKVVFNQSYGVVDIETNTKNTTQHLFHMASVSKPVVAIAIMQLVEQGKVNLDASITRYLPYFQLDDTRLNKVTIKGLLTHTSGMPDTADYQWKTPQTDKHALERWLRQQSYQKLLTTPEEHWNYSNLGYEILGDVIAKVSGISFESYVKKNIFIPLGMKRSTFLLREVPNDLRVKPHSGILKSFSLPFYPYNRRHAPSSSYHTNGDELSLWLSAFSNVQRIEKIGILKPETIKTMWLVPYGERRDWGMALGWFKRINHKRITYYHGGADDGFRAHMEVYNDRDAAYGFMINKDQGPLEEIRVALQQATENQPLPPIPKMTDSYKVATLYQEKGIDGIVSFVDEKLSKNGKGANLEPVYFLLYDMYLSSSFKKMEKLAEALITRYGNYYSLYVYLGYAKYELNKTEEAMTVAKKALELPPEDDLIQTLIEKIILSEKKAN